MDFRCVTQPLDTIKTRSMILRYRAVHLLMLFRMQSIEARTQYRNSFICATRIFKDEGIFTFWSGAMPRLARLVLSGGIVFTV